MTKITKIGELDIQKYKVLANGIVTSDTMVRILDSKNSNLKGKS